MLTISNSLSRRIGRKRYFLIAIAGFTACSLACGLSTSFVEILVFRGLQGLFGGGLQPSQQAIILDAFPPEKRGQGFALTAIATILAPVIGPAVGVVTLPTSIRGIGFSLSTCRSARPHFSACYSSSRRERTRTKTG